jgi:hypothetical protein
MAGKGELSVFIIDRFEGSMAVIEYKDGTFDLPRSLLPPEAKEGHVLKFNIAVDQNETEEQETKIEHLMDEVFEC